MSKNMTAELMPVRSFALSSTHLRPKCVKKLSRACPPSSGYNGIALKNARFALMNHIQKRVSEIGYHALPRVGEVYSGERVEENGTLVSALGNRPGTIK